MENNAIDAIHKIAKHFIYLHGVLQHYQESLVIEVKTHHVTLSEDLQCIDNELRENLKICEEDLKRFDSYRHEMPKCVYIPSEISQTQLLLSNLSYTVFNDQCPNPYKLVELDHKSLLKEIKTFCSISLAKTKSSDQQGSIKLLLPSSDYVDIIQDTKRMSGLREAEGHKNTVKVDTVNSTHDDSNVMKTARKETDNLKFSSVKVSYIKSATCFYVQRNTFQNGLGDLSEMCNQEGAMATGVEDEIKLDDIYLVRHTDKKFYRARVIDTKQQSTDNYTVIFIDYGSTGVFHKANFRPISKCLSIESPGAELCSLYNVTSVPSKNGSNDVIQMMSDIISK